jgi:hypothetical protein
MITVLIIFIVAFVVCFMLWSIDKYESACTGDCEQGRKCNCLIGKDDE